MNLTVHLMRHGETGQESPRRFLGQRDVPLSDSGRAQALLWREALSGVDYAGAWCSDLSRCRETAEIVLEGRPLQAVPLAGLREIALGEWDGLTAEEVKARFPGQHEARGADMAGFRVPGGESFEDVAHRACCAFEGILAENRIADGATLLIVAHAGVNRAILCRLLGMPLAGLFRLGQDHACLNVIAYRKGAPELRALNLDAWPPARTL
ncbi:histidine phosphatase family protein [Fundidesulfovibrio terrae]|uniref:histidine phosphatase family protein n=1 Tax=Fundidesulfovibrio terrae TaxID=2922866 RepID=UPI001FAF6C0D